MSNAPKRPTATMADFERERDAGRAVELVDGTIVEKAAPTLTVMRWQPSAYAVVLTADIDDQTIRAEPFDAIELSLRELFGKD